MSTAWPSDNSPASAFTSNRHSTGELHVLLVDDNPQDRLLVVRELRKEYPDLRVVEPLTERQLVEALEGNGFDVVITDYQLRWTTGLAVLRAVKARLPRCPVIMFTATGSEEVAVEAMKEGLDDYIIKSVVHLVRLRASLRTTLDRAATARQVQQLATRLSALLSNLKLGVFRRTQNATLLECNEAFRRILALHPDDPLTSHRLNDFFCDARDAERLKEAVRGGQPLSSFEVRMRRADGIEIWASLDESVPEPSADPQIVEGLLEDISDRKQTEEALRRTEAELAHVARVTTLGELMSGLAHEVNQPLSAIANYAVACLKQLEHSRPIRLAELRDWMQGISDQAQRAAGIMQGIRQFVRRQEPTRAEHDLNELLEEALSLLDFEVRRWHIRLYRHFTVPSPRVFVDRLQIQQVAVNLLQNAIESMQSCEPACRELTVATRDDPRWAEVEVRDRGSGIAHPEQLFKAFFTTKPQGLGMGLAVSQTIIHSHGGRIWASSPPGGGASFHFSISRAETAQDEQATDRLHRR